MTTAPSEKSTAVTSAPRQASRQAIRASGMTLKTMAKRSVVAASETSVSPPRHAARPVSPPSGSVAVTRSAFTSTTPTMTTPTKRHHVTKASPRFRSCFHTLPAAPAPDFGCTFHMWLRARLS